MWIWKCTHTYTHTFNKQQNGANFSGKSKAHKRRKFSLHPGETTGTHNAPIPSLKSYQSPCIQSESADYIHSSQAAWVDGIPDVILRTEKSTRRNRLVVNIQFYICTNWMFKLHLVIPKSLTDSPIHYPTPSPMQSKMMTTASYVGDDDNPGGILWVREHLWCMGRFTQACSS